MNKEVIDYIETRKLKGQIDFLVMVTSFTAVGVTPVLAFLLSLTGGTESSVVSGIVMIASIFTLGCTLELREKNIVV